MDRTDLTPPPHPASLDRRGFLLTVAVAAVAPAAARAAHTPAASAPAAARSRPSLRPLFAISPPDATPEEQAALDAIANRLTDLAEDGLALHDAGHPVDEILAGRTRLRDAILKDRSAILGRIGPRRSGGAIRPLDDAGYGMAMALWGSA